MMDITRANRIMIKISGEALMGDKQYGLDNAMLEKVTADIGEVIKMGKQVCLVVGGGNIFRGVSHAAQGIERATADYMGMIATIMNAIALQNFLENAGYPTRVQSALEVQAICEPYIRRRAIRHMEKNRIVIFAAGTGNPFFTTDTAAALRATEMDCDILMKATKVDGIYDKDPAKFDDAKRYDHITYAQVINNELQVMDTNAIVICRNNKVPICVFSLFKERNLYDIMSGKNSPSLVYA